VGFDTREIRDWRDDDKLMAISGRWDRWTWLAVRARQRLSNQTIRNDIAESSLEWRQSMNEECLRVQGLAEQCRDVREREVEGRATRW